MGQITEDCSYALQLERKGRNLGKIHASERGIMYRKDVHVAYKDKAECTVAGIAGMAMDGEEKFLGSLCACLPEPAS